MNPRSCQSMQRIRTRHFWTLLSPPQLLLLLITRITEHTNFSSHGFVFQSVSLRGRKKTHLRIAMVAKPGIRGGKSAPFVCYWVSCDEMGREECV